CASRSFLSTERHSESDCRGVPWPRGSYGPSLLGQGSRSHHSHREDGALPVDWLVVHDDKPAREIEEMRTPLEYDKQGRPPRSPGEKGADTVQPLLVHWRRGPRCASLAPSRSIHFINESRSQKRACSGQFSRLPISERVYDILPFNKKCLI